MVQSYLHLRANGSISSNDNNTNRSRRRSLKLNELTVNNTDMDSSSNNIIVFINSLPDAIVSSNEKKSMIDDINAMSPPILMDLYRRIKSDIMSANRTLWESKLRNYIEGYPPPPKYKSDKGSRNPVQFLEEEWGQFLDHGVLYQDILSDYDGKLIPALHRHWQTHGRGQGDRLPPPKRERTDAIIQHVAASCPYTLEEIRRALHAGDRRGARVGISR